PVDARPLPRPAPRRAGAVRPPRRAGGHPGPPRRVGQLRAHDDATDLVGARGRARPLRPQLPAHGLAHGRPPCPASLKEAWIGLVGGDRLMELYGGTELQAYCVVSGTERLEHRGTVGRPVFGEMVVLDPDGRRLPPGEIGEIYMRRSAI